MMWSGMTQQSRTKSAAAMYSAVEVVRSRTHFELLRSRRLRASGCGRNRSPTRLRPNQRDSISDEPTILNLFVS